MPDPPFVDFRQSWQVVRVVGLDGGADVQKTKEVLRIIGAIKIPWVLIGDFKGMRGYICFKYLGGTILAPDDDFTCTSNGSDRLLDFSIASKHFAEYIQAKPFYDHPCQPHNCVSFFPRDAT